MLNNLRPRSIPWLMRLRAMDIPLVYAVSIAPTNKSRKPQKRIMWGSKLRRLYNQLDCIVTNNTPLRDMVEALGVTTRIEVIPNGIDLGRFRPDRDQRERHAIRQSLGIGVADQVICAVGAVIPRKGSDLLLEAWARVVRRHPNTHVVFVGPQTHMEQAKLVDFRRRIEDLIRASGLPGHVHFTGVVDNPEAYLQASDLLVLASEREGMPNSVLEAMATSLPVVVTPYRGISGDIGVPGRHYLLSEPNADALARRIEELLEDPGRRLELGGRARQWLEQTMGLDRSVDRYADLYRELAGCH
jgi:glycosyltransferase involved in cell wall biosynthesis